MRLVLFLLMLLTLAACSSTPSQVSAVFPGYVEPPVADDINPDPDVVEVRLTAARTEWEFVKGVRSEVMTYNGSVPGPQIRCKRGDRLIVHFENRLDHESTIHWHGVRLPANMDGSHLSQDPVPPGGSFTYDFVVPDAALFWYHPHHMGQDQLYRGMYGPLLVSAEGEPQSTTHRVLVLSDIGLEPSGRVIAPEDLLTSQRDRAMGVEGNTQLVNGQVRPQLRMRRGGRERWRIVNAAGARYFNLTVPGSRLLICGSDGGLLAAPVDLGSVLLSPGERVDVLVSAPEEAGSTLQLVDLGYSRLVPEMGQAASSVLADLITISPAAALPALPGAWGDVPELPRQVNTRNFVLNARLIPPPGSPQEDMAAMPEARYLINGQSFPAVPSFTVGQGEVELWTVENHSQMDHPFHIHGMRFQVLDTDGRSPAYGGWRDTVNIPTSAAAPTQTRLLVSFDGHPGAWVYHCHILFHQEQGMMADFLVE